MNNFGRLALRASVGGFFVGHGTQKLFGWFDGYGLDQTAQMFEGMGMRPGKRNAIAAGAAEAGGGAALVLGKATPLAAGVLTSTMLTAIARVHGKNGPWVTKGGYEYNVVLIAAVLALADAPDEKGKGRALSALLLGVAGAVGAHLAAEATPPAPSAAPDPDPADAAAAVEEPPAAEAA